MIEVSSQRCVVSICSQGVGAADVMSIVHAIQKKNKSCSFSAGTQARENNLIIFASSEKMQNFHASIDINSIPFNFFFT